MTIKYSLLVFFCLIVFSGCQSKAIYQEKDKSILNDILIKFKDKKEQKTADLVLEIGKNFLNTPYVGHTLETEPEQMVVNLRELDCTTFAENCLAIARTVKSKKPSFKTFTAELKRIRYRDGIMDGYPSRLHYFSDWIYNNSHKGLVKPVSESIAHKAFIRTVNFMTSHTDSYCQLKDNPAFVETINNQEKIITERKKFYIPKEILADYENQLKDGDIIGITTNIEGMDIVHVGIIVFQSGRPHLMHASSSAGKVIISEKPLSDYLLNWSKATGIMVARPL